MSDEMLCSICLSDKLNSEKVELNTCHHAFCFNCIEEWLMHGDTCPLDRKPVAKLICYDSENGNPKVLSKNDFLEKTLEKRLKKLVNDRCRSCVQLVKFIEKIRYKIVIWGDGNTLQEIDMFLHDHSVDSVDPERLEKNLKDAQEQYNKDMFRMYRRVEFLRNTEICLLRSLGMVKFLIDYFRIIASIYGSCNNKRSCCNDHASEEYLKEQLDLFEQWLDHYLCLMKAVLMGFIDYCDENVKSIYEKPKKEYIFGILEDDDPNEKYCIICTYACDSGVHFRHCNHLICQSCMERYSIISDGCPFRCSNDSNNLLCLKGCKANSCECLTMDSLHANLVNFAKNHVKLSLDRLNRMKSGFIKVTKLLTGVDGLWALHKPKRTKLIHHCFEHLFLIYEMHYVSLLVENLSIIVIDRMRVKDKGFCKILQESQKTIATAECLFSETTDFFESFAYMANCCCLVCPDIVDDLDKVKLNLVRMKLMFESINSEMEPVVKRSMNKTTKELFKELTSLCVEFHKLQPKKPKIRK